MATQKASVKLINKEYSWEQMSLWDYLAANSRRTVWLLWGGHAHAYKSLTKGNQKHVPVVATHPSPFSANRASNTAPAFCGSNVFQDANDHLSAMNHDPVEW